MSALSARVRTARPDHQRGSFMLEALIGILIFSFGILGLVRMQAQSIRHVSEAQYRSEAVYLANSLVSQMWADNQGSLAAKYQTGGAGYDSFTELAKRLPGSDKTANAPKVTVAPGPSNGSRIVTVQLFWNMPGEDESNPSLCGSDGKKCQHNYTTSAVVGLNLNP